MTPDRRKDWAAVVCLIVLILIGLVAFGLLPDAAQPVWWRAD